MLRIRSLLLFVGVALLAGCNGDDSTAQADGAAAEAAPGGWDSSGDGPGSASAPEDEGSSSAPPGSNPSASPDGPSLAGLQRFMVVSNSESRTNDSNPGVVSSASFWQLSEPFQGGPDPAAGAPSINGCIENGFGPTGAPPSSNLYTAPDDLQAVSAGDTVQLSSPDGTWATLMKKETEADLGAEGQVEVHEGGILYTATDLSAPIPASLQLDVPGDEYPATSVSLPGQQPELELSDRETLLSQIRSGTLRWTPTPNTPAVASSLLVAILHFDVSDPSNGTLRGATCALVDDGEFELPDSVRSLVTDGLDINFLLIRRTVLHTLVLLDEVLFYQQEMGDLWADIN